MTSSPLSALVLLGVATLVGAFAFLSSGDGPADSEARVVDLPPVQGPEVMSLTPHEKRISSRLEGARREIEEARKRGTVNDRGVIVVPDVDGTPLYIHPELIEAKGRYGEPLYLTAKYKRRAAAPLRELKQRVPEHLTPKFKDLRDEVIVGFGDKPSQAGGAKAAGGADAGETGAEGKSKPGKGKGKGKKDTSKPGGGG